MPVAYYHSPIGILRITESEGMIYAVEFREEEEEAESALTPCLIQALQQLKEYFSGTRQVFDLPLQPEGSEFQQKTWEELLMVPYGKTSSYLDLAIKLGDRNYNRAVGNANGKNPIAIIVPCHRIIGSNGKLVGYAGGLWRKKWLLEHENRFSNGIMTLF